MLSVQRAGFTETEPEQELSMRRRVWKSAAELNVPTASEEKLLFCMLSVFY